MISGVSVFGLITVCNNMKKRKSHGVQPSKFDDYEDSFKPILLHLSQSESASFLVGPKEYRVPHDLENLHQTYKCEEVNKSSSILRRTGAEILEGYVELLKKNGSKEDQKRFAIRIGCELYARLEHIKNLRKKLESAKRTMAVYCKKKEDNDLLVSKLPLVTQRLYEKYLRTPDKSAFPKAKLEMIPDVRTREDIEKKYKSAKEKNEQAKHSLELFCEGKYFKSLNQLVNFLENELGIYAPKTSVTERSAGRRGSLVGRSTKLPPDIEKNLLDAVLYYDKRGFLMDKNAVCDLARELCRRNRKTENFEFGYAWYDAWYDRMNKKHPELELKKVVKKMKKGDKAKWFCPDTMEWWFNSTTTRLCELGVAEKNQSYDPHKEVSEENCELRFLHPARVFFSDETSVKTDGYSAAKSKCITSKANRDVENNSSMLAPQDKEVHFTLVAGHNALGQSTVPVYVFARGRPKDELFSRMKAACVTYKDLGASNNIPWSEPIIDFNTKGSITQENIGNLMIKSIETMYPDVSEDDPAKRVIWFTDNHGSRFESTFVDRLAAMGVHLFGWMPNTTSKCQSMDVKIFGKLKTVIEGMSKRKKGFIDEVGKIEIVKEALKKCAKPNDFLEGLRRTGMLPFSRKVILEHPDVKLGHALSTEERYQIAVDSVSAMRRLKPEDVKAYLQSSSNTLRERGLPFDEAKVWLSTVPDLEQTKSKARDLKRRIDALKEGLLCLDGECRKSLVTAVHKNHCDQNRLIETLVDWDLLKRLEASSSTVVTLYKARFGNCIEFELYEELHSWYLALAEQLGGISDPLDETTDLETIKYAAAIILHFVRLFERVDRAEFGSPLLKKLSKANPLVLKEVKGYSNSPLRKFAEVSQQLKRKKKRSVYRPMHATNVLMANDQCKGGSTELTDESRRKRIRTLAETRNALARDKQDKRMQRSQDAYNKFKANELRVIECMQKKVNVPLTTLREWVKYRRRLVEKVPAELAAIDSFDGNDGNGRPLFTKAAYKIKALQYFSSATSRISDAL